MIGFPVLILLVFAIFRTNATGEVYDGVEFPDGPSSITSRHFVVLGATGSGKTTLIKALTASSIEELSSAGNRQSLDSQTRECKRYEATKEIQLNKQDRLLLSFVDTIGFGANDLKSKEIVADVFENIVLDAGSKIHGFIIVHKAERFRESYVEDLLWISRMFEMLGVKPSHVLLVVTHTAMFNGAVREEYTKKLYTQLNKVTASPIVTKSRIVHVNFARIDELTEPFRSFFAKTHKPELLRVSKILLSFNQPVNPLTYIAKLNNIKQNIHASFGNNTAKANLWFEWVIRNSPMITGVLAILFVVGFK